MRYSFKVFLLFFISILFFFFCFSQNKNVQVWLTNNDKTLLLAKQLSPLSFKTITNNHLPTINIDAGKTYQPIDGFGFCLTGGSAQLLMQMSPLKRTALLHQLFDTGKNDAGISYLRVTIGASDMNDHVYSYNDLPDGETDTTLAKFDLNDDKKNVIPVLKEIVTINPHIKILGSPWSAPAWMKTNNNPKGGKLKPEYYEVYANYFVKYITAMKENGITIDAVTLQNEPLNEKNTPSMQVLAVDEANFIKKNIGPLFKKQGIKTKIVLYDHNCDVPEYATSILDDAEAKQYVDGSGFHLYGGTIDAMSAVHNAHPDKNLYFTEQMVIDIKKFDVVSPVQNLIIGATANWSRNVLLWNLAADEHYEPHTNDGGCPVCEGAVTITGDSVTRNVAYYTVAHASKFVRPGAVRIATTGGAAISNVAFKTKNGIVLILANSSDSAQTFNVQYNKRMITPTLNSHTAATFVW